MIDRHDGRLTWRSVVGPALVALLGVALASTAVSAIRNQYLALGFTRTPWIVLGDEIRSAAPIVGALGLWCALVVLAIGRLPRRSRSLDASAPGARFASPARRISLAIASGLAITALLRVAYAFNRFHADVNWSWRRDWHGLPVPDVFFRPMVWLQNAGIILGAAVCGWLLYRLLWLGLGRRPSAARALHRVAAAWPTIVATTLALVALLIVAHAHRARTPERPNVVVISLDTLRADHLGAYGYSRPTSPTLDAFARDGVLFEWTIGQAEATLPSHMSIFTAKLPSGHGVWNHNHVLAPPVVTMAEAFREEGYRTAAFVDAGHMLKLFGFGQGFDVYHDRFKRLAGSVDMAIEWLDALGDDDRYLLFVHGYDIHTPYSPWSPYRKDFVDPTYTEPAVEPNVDTMAKITWRLAADSTYVDPIDARNREYIVACYDAAIRWADDQVARLLAHMQARGDLDDTWVVVLSDHGEEFGEHGAYLHEKLYHTVTHVPLIVRPPSGPLGARFEARRGARVSDVTSLVDVFPTLAEISSIPARADWVGASLVPYLEGRSARSDLAGDAPDSLAAGRRAASRVAYSQSYRFGHVRAITSDSLHILSSEDARDHFELYRHREDRAEQDPTRVMLGENGALVDGPYDARGRALTGRLRQWMDETRARILGNEARRFLGSDFKTLRNLGYIQ